MYCSVFFCTVLVLEWSWNGPVLVLEWSGNAPVPVLEWQDPGGGRPGLRRVVCRRPEYHPQADETPQSLVSVAEAGTFLWRSSVDFAKQDSATCGILSSRMAAASSRLFDSSWQLAAFG